MVDFGPKDYKVHTTTAANGLWTKATNCTTQTWEHPYYERNTH